jgi:hypothetical protein
MFGISSKGPVPKVSKLVPPVVLSLYVFSKNLNIFRRIDKS